MDAETVRIEFDDGTWWDVYAEMPYGVRRKSQRLFAPYMVQEGDSMVVDQAKFDPIVLVDLSMAKLIGCTAAWSWDDPVTEETIEQRPTAKVEKVSARMDELYNEDEVEPPARGKKRTSGSPAPG